MCDPVSATMAASSVVSFVGQSQAAKIQNNQAAQAHEDALVAATQKYGDLQRKYYFDNTSINQEGYKAAMKSRAEQGTMSASAGSSGTGGITYGNLVAASRQIGGENEARVQSKRDDLTTSLDSNLTSVQTEARSRINSTPFVAGPNPLGLAVSLAGAGVLGAANASGVDVNKMGWSGLGKFLGINPPTQ